MLKNHLRIHAISMYLQYLNNRNGGRGMVISYDSPKELEELLLSFNRLGYVYISRYFGVSDEPKQIDRYMIRNLALNFPPFQMYMYYDNSIYKGVITADLKPVGSMTPKISYKEIVHLMPKALKSFGYYYAK